MIARIEPSWIITVNTPPGSSKPSSRLADQQMRRRRDRQELGEALTTPRMRGMKIRQSTGDAGYDARALRYEARALRCGFCGWRAGWRRRPPARAPPRASTAWSGARSVTIAAAMNTLE